MPSGRGDGPVRGGGPRPGQRHRRATVGLARGGSADRGGGRSTSAGGGHRRRDRGGRPAGRRATRDRRGRTRGALAQDRRCRTPAGHHRAGRRGPAGGPGPAAGDGGGRRLPGAPGGPGRPAASLPAARPSTVPAEEPAGASLLRSAGIPTGEAGLVRPGPQRPEQLDRLQVRRPSRRGRSAGARRRRPPRDRAAPTAPTRPAGERRAGRSPSGPAALPAGPCARCRCGAAARRTR
jgi:hypothetical protein